MFSLTHSQRRVALADLRSPGTADNHVVHAVALDGAPGPDVLRKAMGAVVSRHPLLAAEFCTSEDGTPGQRIGAPVDLEAIVDPVVHEARGATVTEAVRAAAADWWDTPFDLTRPLPRLRVVRLGDGRRMLLLSTHHIVCDGWSARLVERDIRAACASGGTLPPAEGAGFAEHVAAEQAALDRMLEEDLPFWRGALGGFEPAVAPWSTGADVRRVEHVARVPATQLRAFDGLGRRERLAALLGAAAEVLAAPVGARRICLGTVSSGRFDRRFHGVVGCFVNPVAVPVDLVQGERPAERVARLSAAVEACLAHARIPYDEVVRHLPPPDRRRPWFDVMVSLNDWTVGLAASGDHPIILPAPTTSSGLMLDATRDVPDRWHIRGRWPEPLLPEATGRALVDALVRALSRPAGRAPSPSTL